MKVGFLTLVDKDYRNKITGNLGFAYLGSTIESNLGFNDIYSI